MEPSDNKPHFSECAEADTSMASIARNLIPPDIAGSDVAPSFADGNAFLKKSDNTNGAATGPSTRNTSSKYRHIAAIHSRVRNSCLSRETEVIPSFLGFRNLMVIVLSTSLFIVKGCGFREELFQCGLIKSVQSCNESSTSY